MSVGEMGGGELVCRLVAATPPYLYSPAGLPHGFFFSELLRGLVEARASRQGGSPPPKRLRGCPPGTSPGSAFTAPPPTCLPPPPTSRAAFNPLSASRLVPRLETIYREIKAGRKEPLPAVIGLELVVDYVKHERQPVKQTSP